MVADAINFPGSGISEVSSKGKMYVGVAKLLQRREELLKYVVD